MRSQNRISGNQPLDLGQFEQPNNLIIVELTFFIRFRYLILYSIYSCMVNDSLKTLSRQNDILSCSSIVGMFYSFIAVEFH